MIKSNNLKLPGKKVKSNEKEKDPTLATVMTVNLRSAYLFRTEQVKELCKHEFFGIAQSISDERHNLYHGTKSEITKRFEGSEKIITNISTKNAIVIELSVIIKAKTKSLCSTFNGFAEEVYASIMFLAKGYERYDVVTDRYFAGCLKEGFREKQGSSGSKLIFNGLTPFPSLFGEDFLNNSENKEALNIFLANTLTKLHRNDEQIFVVTQHYTIIYNTRSTFSEEADAKLINHCINLADQGYKHIVLRTVDSNVLVLNACIFTCHDTWCNNNLCSIWCWYLQKVLQH